jgi:glutathione S-transferase
VFALEVGVAHAFRPIFDITALEAAAYGENPALKMPVLLDEEGPLFGTENICRALLRRSGRTGIVMRGDSASRLVANAEELTLHAMSSEVILVMGAPKLGPIGAAAQPKVSRSLENCLDWLDARIDAVLGALPPERSVSFLEVALFCGVTHLPFRKVIDVSRWERLGAFCRRFGERPSARQTEYRYDAP